MSSNGSLNDRMKEFYEDRCKTYLTRKVPVIIRIDGRAFHTFTRGFDRPYDKVFHEAMNATLLYLCKNIPGCKFGYTQSDEITLVLTDYDTLSTDGWFDYAVQKLCSISASMATLEFNRQFMNAINRWWSKPYAPMDDSYAPLYNAYIKSATLGAMFDARVFSIPEDEIVNSLIWRQQDATRNAIQMLGQTHFSQKELEHKTVDMIQEMLFSQKGINFNDMPVEFKRGVCCYRHQVPCESKDSGYKLEWKIDYESPIFTKDRNYVEKHFQRSTS